MMVDTNLDMVSSFILCVISLLSTTLLDSNSSVTSIDKISPLILFKHLTNPSTHSEYCNGLPAHKNGSEASVHEKFLSFCLSLPEILI